jgi:transposase-like protein
LQLDVGDGRRDAGERRARWSASATAVPVHPGVLDELIPAAWHHIERYANNRIEADHGRLKHRLRPVRGLHTDRTAQVVINGLAILQTVRRGHYELATESPRQLRVAAAFTELALAI